MVLVDIAKAADVVALCLPIAPGEPLLDAPGRQALQVLRTMGLPHPVVLLQNAGTTLKERAASKKAAATALESELPGDHRMCPVDTPADCAQLLRGLVEARIEAPMWRRARSQLLIEKAEYSAAESAPGSAVPGLLYLSAYVRQVGLSANQLVSLPGGGDFRIARIEAGDEGVSLRGHGSLAAGTVLGLPDGDRCVAACHCTLNPCPGESHKTTLRHVSMILPYDR